MERHQNDFINELVVYAERYAINRGSYANGTTAQTVAQLVEMGILTPKTVATLIRDVKQALHDKSMPYADQEDEWKRTLDIMEKYMSIWRSQGGA